MNQVNVINPSHVDDVLWQIYKLLYQKAVEAEEAEQEQEASPTQRPETLPETAGLRDE